MPFSIHKRAPPVYVMQFLCQIGQCGDIDQVERFRREPGRLPRLAVILEICHLSIPYPVAIMKPVCIWLLIFLV